MSALATLIEEKLTRDKLLQHSASFLSGCEYNAGLIESNKVAAAIRRRIPKANLSVSMSEKIAKSGLSYRDLELAFKRKGSDGIHLLLTEKDTNGKFRVTNSSKVEKKLCEFFVAAEKEAAKKEAEQKKTAGKRRRKGDSNRGSTEK